ncbi:MAG: thioredoxin family protein [Ferruginibacter sp.]
MRVFKSLLIIIFSFILFVTQSNAQDSLNIQWETVAKKISEQEYEVKINGVIKDNWYLYTNKDDVDGLAGIVISYNDPSISAGPLKFNAKYTAILDPIFDNHKKNVAAGNIEIIQLIRFTNAAVPVLRFNINYEVANKEEFLQEEQKQSITLDTVVVASTSNRILSPSIDIKQPVTTCGNADTTESKGLANVFWLGFLGGFVALILPCLFPMIPLTVSFFTKKSTSKKAGIRNAFLYGFFIFFIYILISLPFHFLEKISPEILNNISTNVYLNVFFFAIFVFFAVSFFGYFEITLPAGLSSRADSKAGVGNVAGIFFMALTLALVSFSCTGPILGSLLAGSLSGPGGAMRLTFGMGGFGLALALPFALFALFPNWLNSLPKSGGWLNTVKVVLGFIELALAFKFFSNADLVMHWNILKREVFIGIWIIIGLGLTLYLFGKIKFPHDSPIKKLSAGRIMTGIIVLAFSLYLIPGVTNTKWANLSLISGFPPPLNYSIYTKETADTVHFKNTDCVLGLNCSHDYEEGLQMARKENKPVLLDFTGYACVNCRRMEENVWSQPDVYKLMKERFIVISLYVDDKKDLPAAKQFTYKTKNGIDKDIITVGDKWATFQTENFAKNAQPMYAILNTDEVLLSHPVEYTKDPKVYLAWLQCGLDAFYKK